MSGTLRNALQAAPVVALLGPRQVGKTTLARHVTQTLDGPAIYLDLERPSDANKLAEPELYLTRQFGKTVVLDEVQRQPDLFPLLRSLVDEQIRAGSRSGQYLVLGSASPDLLRQSSESLAGRIIYLELTPMHLKELEVQGALNLERHWIRGGFPLSYLAETEENSLLWRTNFIRTYLERDLPQLGLRLPAEQLQRFWAMLGHGQGNPLNASRLA
ncbi:MAG: AAA family ATPase, partial [Candidatus Latescibacteria bacterium]|nr:AAA family ATPase [Candidatus Latescibacterota bacterium]